MIKIQTATIADAEILALLGRITWVESHGHFIEDKNDLQKYTDTAFSVSKTRSDLNDSKNLFYIIYVNDLPAGYAKLILNAKQENVTSQNNCKLDRIYMLNDFIPLKIGQKLLNFVEEKANALQLDTMWLCVYIKNNRAIRFYEKNGFKDVGKLNFLVSGKEYNNTVFSKNI